MKDETTVAFDDNQDDLPAIRFGAKLFGHTDSPLQPTLALSSKVRKSHFQAHIHNEFVSGSRELATTRVGARIVASADAGLDFDHQRVRDGDAYFTESRGQATPPDTVIACTTPVGDASNRGQPR